MSTLVTRRKAAGGAWAGHPRPPNMQGRKSSGLRSYLLPAKWKSDSPGGSLSVEGKREYRRGWYLRNRERILAELEVKRRSTGVGPPGLRFVDLTGSRVGDLAVLGFVGRNRHGQAVWRCHCVCGAEKNLFHQNLRAGTTKSCGCKKGALLSAAHRSHLVGERFGRLVVVGEAGSTRGRCSLWLCRCDCGSEKTVRGAALTGGRTKSCGCLLADLRASQRAETEKKEAEAKERRKALARAKAEKKRAEILAERTARLITFCCATCGTQASGRPGPGGVRHYCSSRCRERAKESRRRAKETGAAGWSYTNPALIQSRVTQHGSRCYYCGGPYESIDHRIPLARGGGHWPANLVPSCHSCNSLKGARTESEFRRAA
jgi:hypothetical protein